MADTTSMVPLGRVFNMRFLLRCLMLLVFEAGEPNGMVPLGRVFNMRFRRRSLMLLGLEGGGHDEHGTTWEGF